MREGADFFPNKETFAACRSPAKSSWQSACRLRCHFDFMTTPRPDCCGRPTVERTVDARDDLGWVSAVQSVSAVKKLFSQDVSDPMMASDCFGARATVALRLEHR